MWPIFVDGRFPLRDAETVRAGRASPRGGRRGRVLGWELSDRARRLDKQPQDEREAFDLVRIQGTSPSEAAEVLEVSVRTVNRRLHRGLQLLAATLGDLYPGGRALPRIPGYQVEAVLGRGGMGVAYAWR